MKLESTKAFHFRTQKRSQAGLAKIAQIRQSLEEAERAYEELQQAEKVALDRIQQMEAEISKSSSNMDVEADEELPEAFQRIESLIKEVEAQPAPNSGGELPHKSRRVDGKSADATAKEEPPEGDPTRLTAMDTQNSENGEGSLGNQPLQRFLRELTTLISKRKKFDDDI